MSAPDGGEQSAAEPVYYEPARSYVTAGALFVLIAVGFTVDLAIGAGLLHLWAWLGAVVLVVGIDVLSTHAARVMRSITVTPTEVRVGEQGVPRDSIVGALTGFDRLLPVLGQSAREGLPRSIPGLAVHLAGGGVLLVPTRYPERLAAALDLSIEAPDLDPPGPAELRPAEPDDLALLPEIDRRAESLFRVSGLDLPQIPFPVDELPDAKAIFVVGRPAVGFVWIDEVDGVAHIEELAVVPARMRAGLGTALLAAACTWAAADGYPAITLTTFVDVEWNAPFYAARGFAVVDDLSPGLVQVRDWERSVGLDAVARRVVMRRELAASLRPRRAEPG